MKKLQILNIEGKKVKEIEMPEFFNSVVREDLIFKVLETKKTKQPYAPSLVAGKQHSASGIIRHRRHVWKTHYGQGISRIPRKIISKKGNRINWIGAEISSTVGGRRAHPPKILSMINTKAINKKEMKIAFVSALSATANTKEILKKYSTLEESKFKGKEIPFVVEGKITSLKTKQFLGSLKKILENLFDVAVKKKSVRAGKGKLRGRKYKKNAGLLLVVGKDEKIKTTAVDVKNVKNLSVVDLAKGGQGRLVIYTENAIKDLQNKLGDKK